MEAAQQRRVAARMREAGAPDERAIAEDVEVAIGVERQVVFHGPGA
jgi:hypothetical protein